MIAETLVPDSAKIPPHPTPVTTPPPLAAVVASLGGEQVEQCWRERPCVVEERRLGRHSSCIIGRISGEYYFRQKWDTKVPLICAEQVFMVLNQEEIEKCREAFERFDKDGSGTIDAWELKETLKVPEFDS